jgi:hypothetical protein
LTVTFGFAAVFFAERGLTTLRAVGLAEVALLAFGLEAGLALTARFAVFAVGFAFERDADRLKPFVRLLLMWVNLKRLLTFREQPKNARELTTEAPLNHAEPGRLPARILDSVTVTLNSATQAVTAGGAVGRISAPAPAGPPGTESLPESDAATASGY